MVISGGRSVRADGASAKVFLVDQLHEVIRGRIILGDFKGDDILVESRLAAEFDVSKTPVREALALLSQEGLVEVIPRQGYRVTPISIRDIHEIYELRVLLEGEDASLAAKRATAEEVAAFRDDIHRRATDLEMSHREILAEEVLALDDAFHSGIAELAGNRRLKEAVQRLLRDAMRLRMTDPYSSPDGLREEAAGTEQIYDALSRGDSDTARRILQEHVLHSKDRVMQNLVRRGGSESIRLTTI
ncbi:GntR family transcriptional regulator [bacterium]|nr:GntR family transcriptional regulator [bacterium]